MRKTKIGRHEGGRGIGGGRDSKKEQENGDASNGKAKAEEENIIKKYVRKKADQQTHRLKRLKKERKYEGSQRR